MAERIKIEKLSQLPQAPVTLDSMAWNPTGLWRYLEPSAQNKTAPCRKACPADMPSPAFIEAIAKGDPSRALEIILKVNPLPGVTSRLCYHPCQINCLRRRLDRPLKVPELERHAADQGEPPAPPARPAREQKVAVLGSGPAESARPISWVWPDMGSPCMSPKTGPAAIC